MSGDVVHLDNAARVLRAILAERQPEHSWRVDVREGDGDDRAGLITAADGEGQVGPVGEHPHPIRERHAGAAPARPLDHDGGQEAA